MPNPSIRIVLVDDHPVVRNSWRTVLETFPHFQIVADYDNGLSVIAEAEKHRDDIMLIDINMTPLGGFAVTERILSISASQKIIGLSLNNEPIYAEKMIRLGARGYLTKTSSLEEIHRVIAEVHKGNLCICEEVLRQMPPEK